MRAACDPELEAERGVQRLEHPLHDPVLPLDDAGDVPALDRELFAGGEIDAGDLEQRDVLGAGIDARARRLDQAGHDRRPEDRLVRRHRIRQPNGVAARILGDEAPRVRLRQAGAHERVLDDPPQALLLREPAVDVAPERQRVRDAVEEWPGDLLDQVDLAGHIARTPGRDRHVPLVGDLEPEPPQHRSLLVVGNVEADEARGALGTEVDDRAAPEAPAGRRRARSSALR